MTTRELGVAGVTAAVGLGMIILVGAIGLILRSNTQTSGGGRAMDGDLISIPVAPGDQIGGACNGALLAGTLVAHPEWGIAVRGDSGEQRTIWPRGYVGRISGDGIELLDGNGRVIGRTGDRVEAGGGMTTVDGLEGFGVCPIGIRIQPGR